MYGKYYYCSLRSLLIFVFINPELLKRKLQILILCDLWNESTKLQIVNIKLLIVCKNTYSRLFDFISNRQILIQDRTSNHFIYNFTNHNIASKSRYELISFPTTGSSLFLPYSSSRADILLRLCIHLSPSPIKLRKMQPVRYRDNPRS